MADHLDEQEKLISLMLRQQQDLTAALRNKDSEVQIQRSNTHNLQINKDLMSSNLELKIRLLQDALTARND